MQSAHAAPKTAFRAPEASRPAPFWLKAMAAILAVSLGLSVVMLALIAASPTRHDMLPQRLVDLKARLLGQPSAHVLAYACEVIFSQPERAERAYQCQVNFSDEAMRPTTVISREGVIDALIVPVNAVRLGDLVASWGHPEHVAIEGTVYRARWQGGFSVALRSERRVGYLHPVEAIVFQRQA